MSDEKQPINIYGGYNSIAPSANTANQTVNSPIGQDPVSTTQSNSQSSTHPLNRQPSTVSFLSSTTPSVFLSCFVRHVST